MADRVHPNAAVKANANSNDTINPTADAPPFSSTKFKPYSTSYRPQSPKRHRRSIYCSVCIWLAAIIATAAILLAVASTVVYLIYRPHRLSFSVTSLKIDSFKFTHSSQLNSKFDLILIATNPNKKVKFIYSPISVAVLSNGVDLDDGSFPEFVHEKRNITAMKVMTESGTGEVEGEVADSLKRKIELSLETKMETKVKVEMGWLKINKLTPDLNLGSF